MKQTTNNKEQNSTKKKKIFMEIINEKRRVIGKDAKRENTRVFVCRGILREVPVSREREYDLKADRARLRDSFVPTV